MHSKLISELCKNLDAIHKKKESDAYQHSGQIFLDGCNGHMTQLINVRINNPRFLFNRALTSSHESQLSTLTAKCASASNQINYNWTLLRCARGTLSEPLSSLTTGFTIVNPTWTGCKVFLEYYFKKLRRNVY